MGGLLLPRGRQGQMILPPTASAAVYDPAVLDLTVFLKEFTAAPWEGSDSAGNSGTHDFAELTNPPSAVGGDASFDGTNDQLVGSTTSTYFLVSAYTHVFLVNVTSAIAATPGSPQVDDQIFADSASWIGLRVYNDGGTMKVAGWHYDTGYKTPVAGKALTAGLNMVSTTFNGTTISTDVNLSGAPVTITAANAGGLSGNLVIGRSQSLNYPVMKIREAMASKLVLDSATLGNIKSYFNSEHGLAL